jgi:hypothetical protein
MAASVPSRFVALDEGEVIKSAIKLKDGVAERFPERGLTHEASRIGEYAHALAKEARSLAKRNILADTFIGAMLS